MNLKKKKILATKTFSVGKDRIVFVKTRIDEIKEAITKQDIRDLHKEGAILIKEKNGRKKIVKSRKKISVGKKRKNIGKRKKDYIAITRKLRRYAKELFRKGEINKHELGEIRKKIRNREFKSKTHLKEQIREIKK